MCRCTSEWVKIKTKWFRWLENQLWQRSINITFNTINYDETKWIDIWLIIRLNSIELYYTYMYCPFTEEKEQMSYFIFHWKLWNAVKPKNCSIRRKIQKSNCCLCIAHILVHTIELQNLLVISICHYHVFWMYYHVFGEFAKKSNNFCNKKRVNFMKIDSDVKLNFVANEQWRDVVLGSKHKSVWNRYIHSSILLLP